MSKPDRRMDARKRRVAKALPREPLEPRAMRLPRAERADIEAVARKRLRSAPGSSIFGSCVSATKAV